MATLNKVHLSKTRLDDKVEISLSLQFPANDPRAERIYQGFGQLIASALDEKERDELLKELKRQYADLVNKT